MRLLIEKPTPLPVIDDATFDRLVRLHPVDETWGHPPPLEFLEPLQRHGFLPYGVAGPPPQEGEMIRFTETETLEEALDYARLAVFLLTPEIGVPEEHDDMDKDGTDWSELPTPFLAQWSSPFWELTLVVNRPSILTIGSTVVFILGRKRFCNG